MICITEFRMNFAILFSEFNTHTFRYYLFMIYVSLCFILVLHILFSEFQNFFFMCNFFLIEKFNNYNSGGGI